MIKVASVRRQFNKKLFKICRKNYVTYDKISKKTSGVKLNKMLSLTVILPTYNAITYIEEMLDLTSRPAPIPKLPPDMELDPVIKRLIGCIPPIPQEVIDEDPKLAYILGKGEV